MQNLKLKYNEHKFKQKTSSYNYTKIQCYLKKNYFKLPSKVISISKTGRKITIAHNKTTF